MFDVLGLEPRHGSDGAGDVAQAHDVGIGEHVPRQLHERLAGPPVSAEQKQDLAERLEFLIESVRPERRPVLMAFAEVARDRDRHLAHVDPLVERDPRVPELLPR